MKKFFSMMAVLTAVFAFVACTKGTDNPNNGGGHDNPKGEKLATPELSVKEQTATSFTIAWNAVTGADSYMVNFKGKNYTVTDLEYKFENLNAGEYTVQVLAKGEGYDNSDKAKIKVTLTGLTEADWFSQELFLAEDAENGYTKSNAVWFTWKGEGVTKIEYGLFETASLESATDADIKSELNSIPSDQLGTILQYVNGAEGYTGVFSPVSGSSSYTLCTLVADANGVEYLAKSEITTEALVLTDDAKAWLGTWNVKSHQIYSIEQTGDGTKSAKEDEFTVTITAGESAANEVRIDGLSVLGSDWPTYGIVAEDTLYILNGVYLGSDNQCHYYWVGFYDEPVGLTINEYPSNVATIAADGATATSTNKITLQDENGADLVVECFCSDVMGVTDDGYIQFFIDAFPAVFRTGDMEWTKTDAATAAKSNNARIVPSAMQTSIVVK
jgi:hypothetical protein